MVRPLVEQLSSREAMRFAHRAPSCRTAGVALVEVAVAASLLALILVATLESIEAIGRMIARWTVAGACVVGTAACSLQEITAFERRLPKPPTSHVVMLATPTRREMRLVVKSLANTNNLRIDARTVADIAAWCDGDIRRAVGAIRQLQFEARLRP